MFVIEVYDVNEKRVAKVLKVSRKYLYWVQNSVLEGEISEANFRRLKEELLEIIDLKEDSLIFYTFRTTKYSERQCFGVLKGGEETIF
ncbi:CRISPR-associated endoribonuclease Cas2 [Thermacetogenium phaeum DSM 12270]|jgi:CRISPR-associated protein Cas2|uniref:CRISPR-associated endoribonuclease Cas2 n=2 Tax=Thermacetogenium phaeum TaxID=85874 RepID=K4LKW0_THEPS|nr:CRISPR-associated endonuclease Cas2 [Thermacetogenium phaeum]AFV12615.1 CRISPR-associated endoribonuclease Cas2 [Thermacetogenium phaeum DSM 12270]KUK35957.1 MAG: CRISPR-associated endoribonuclease Cas2 [Thermacetogenium phaeum]MDK2880292.1 CRISPR-associated protein Cas2 [Clostridia bacterium]